MQCPWITLGLIVSILSCLIKADNSNSNSNNNSNSNKHNSPSDLNNLEMKRLWAAALQAINEAETQRLSQRQSLAQSQSESKPQRTNSKRLKWRTNNRVLDNRESEFAEDRNVEMDDEVLPRSGTTLSTSNVQDMNPSYLDVANFTPKPVQWWF